MDAALNYLAACTQGDVDWVEVLRLRAAGVSTTVIGAWVRQQRSGNESQSAGTRMTTGEQNIAAANRIQQSPQVLPR